MFRIGAIIGCVAALLAWVFAPTQEAGRDATDDRDLAARTRVAAVETRTESELASAPDTTGLQRESWTVDELLDELNADLAPGFTPVDRDRFTEIVMSEPELRRGVAE